MRIVDCGARMDDVLRRMAMRRESVVSTSMILATVNDECTSLLSYKVRIDRHYDEQRLHF